MRKPFLLSLLVALLTTIATHAYDFQSGDLYYNITGENTVAVTYQKNLSTSNYQGLTTATIPETVIYNGTTYSVTSIGDDAFENCYSLTSITIPNSVTSIGIWAFFYCSSLTSIILPNSVTSIGDYAFLDCSSLTSITIPNSVTSIGNYAFSSCSSLTSIVVESGNTVYDSRENCNAIIKTATNTLIAGCQSTTIPNSVTRIGDLAFLGCSSLTSITIPNSVTWIGEYAFCGCSSLTSITIPNSVTSIRHYAFQSCTSLTSITCLATTPPSCGTDCFTNVPRTIPLYVPAESIEAYKAADTWKEFQVQALPPSYSPVDLVSITVDGEEIADFDPKALTYNIALPEGTTTIPTISATAYNEEAQVLLIQATTLPGQASAVVITPDSIQTYTVRFTVTTSSDATLATLQYNGISVPDFLPTQTAYTVQLPYNTVEVPVVTATATHPSARVVIVQAGSLTGQASVVVLSADGAQSNIYTVQFSLAPSTDATLSSLTYDGMLVPFFEAGTLHYNVDLPSETSNLPQVDAVANDLGAQITIHQATTLPGEASVEVLAADNTTRLIYTIYFSKKSTPTDISDRPDTTGTNSDKGAEKLLRKGQVLIIRNGKTYNMMGQRL